MARRKKVAPEPAIDRSHIIEDIGRRGEVVGIEGRRGAFRILCEAMNVERDVEWVELFGPLSKGDGSFTAVRPNRLTKRRKRGN